ncbi:MAG: DUF975 family protein [Treponemataceae bacterium]|nr:DUF975 family protein [Treponemataceae bacterium]
MFDRIKYKKFAKTQLAGRWTVPVLMTLICGIISLAISGPGYGGAIADIAAHPAEQLLTAGGSAGDASYWEPLLLILEIIVGSILTIAQIHVYLKLSRSPEPVQLGDFLEGLSLWLRGMLAGIWTTIWVVLWSMLFIIPGIVKAFAYSQIFYLAAEYPSLSIRKAMKVSIEITRGHKGDLLIMYASFLGWMILAAIPAGIGFLWLTPYMQMTAANAYHGLLKEAIVSGRIRKEDLAG